MNQKAEPYLSVVVASRNDDHGGNLLRRMQIFVDTLSGLATRYGLPVELVVVEWNPPDDRPRLPQALNWPTQRAPLSVRIIEVPRQIHSSFAHGEALPLYQMIAKNAGIRRARGAFVLATNVDIVFSAELFAALANRTLDPGRMYRMDRYDVDSGVPLDVTLDERLDYCATHILRVNAYDGCHACTPDGARLPAADDIVAPEGQVFLGSGWHELVGEGRARYRWAGERAEIWIKPSDDEAGSLQIDLAPGPGVGFEPFMLRVAVEPGLEACERPVKGSSRLSVFLPRGASSQRRVRLEAIGGGRPALPNGDERVLNFRVFRIAWTRVGGSMAERSTASGIKVTRVAPVRDGFRRVARAAAGKLAASAPRGTTSPQIHINACGDFTLLSREAWFDLRGYPEFDCFSMNLDAVLCFAAHAAGYRELVLPEPLRIYHIDHVGSAGFTHEEQEQLQRQITARGIPWLSATELLKWASQMRRLSAPMVFNREHWGLSNWDLAECSPPE